MLWQMNSISGGVAILGICDPVTAADLRIEVAGFRNAEATIYAAVCAEDQFLQPACRWFGSAPAASGATVTGVPTGTYAVHVVHDESDNRTLDRLGFLHTEGKGFSGDAPSGSGRRAGTTPPLRWASRAPRCG